MTSSQKTQLFMSEPIRDKPVTDLAGIGEVLGKRLSEKGYDKAYTVLGQFLVFNKNEKLFVWWLKNEVSCNTKQAKECFDCLTEWCEQFL